MVGLAFVGGYYGVGGGEDRQLVVRSGIGWWLDSLSPVVNMASVVVSFGVGWWLNLALMGSCKCRNVPPHSLPPLADGHAPYPG